MTDSSRRRQRRGRISSAFAVCCADGETRIPRIEDGAPALVVGVAHASLGSAESWRHGSALLRATPLALELADGERVAVRGPVAFALGARETRPRRSGTLPKAVLSRLDAMGPGKRFGPSARLGFRSLGEGDPVVLRGRLRSEAADGTDYRGAARRRVIEQPTLTYAGVVRAPTRRRSRALAFVLGGALGVLALGALGEATEQDSSDGRLVGASYADPGSPPLGFALGGLSPFHRRRTLDRLERRYERTVPASEQSVRALIALRGRRSCAAAQAARLSRALYEEVLAHAAACPEARRQELEALLALGWVRRASVLLGRHPSLLEPEEKTTVHVMAGAAPRRRARPRSSSRRCRARRR